MHQQIDGGIGITHQIEALALTSTSFRPRRVPLLREFTQKLKSEGKSDGKQTSNGDI